MGWETVKFEEVSLTPQPVPEGEYVFQVLGGGPSKFDASRLEIKAGVTDGEHSGRQVFFSYPDPESLDSKGNKNDWSAREFKRLTQAVGEDIYPGEDPFAYVVRIIGKTFAAKLAKGKPYETADGEVKTPIRLKLNSVRPGV
jgi:hypothetical protein